METTISNFPSPQSPKERLSILYGPLDPPLVDLTLHELLDLQAFQNGNRECLVIPWTGARWTYNHLSQQSTLLAAALLEIGIDSGDRVGIMAGNCEQYAAVFFAVARIGAILVILNNTYTDTEALNALKFTDCKILFTTSRIGRVDNRKLLSRMEEDLVSTNVVMLRAPSQNHMTYDGLIASVKPRSLELVFESSGRVLSHQVCNLQFTSGTTGQPKASMLTHHNLVNNSRFIGDRLRLTPSDILCCPPPLFHCFGLVLGLLAVVTHGAKIVYPAEMFDANATMQALSDEACTALHGVPAMFDSLLQATTTTAPLSQGFSSASTTTSSSYRLRTGIVAGAPVPRPLMERIVRELGMSELASSYGLTEASPTCFLAHPDDSLSRRLATCGSLMPHAAAKIVDRRTGETLPLGRRGELCMAGYQLHAGYWNNPAATTAAATLAQDDDGGGDAGDGSGTVWLRTGDEAVFHEDGTCTITGRFKEIIIRGGENVYPLEIEERLVTHPAVARAVVVGLADGRYGEVVGAFLEEEDDGTTPTSRRNEELLPRDAKIRSWVREKLGNHKAPAHIFWMGRNGVPGKFPLTGSGKVKKYEMAQLGNLLVKKKEAPSHL